MTRRVRVARASRDERAMVKRPRNTKSTVDARGAHCAHRAHIFLSQVVPDRRIALSITVHHKQMRLVEGDDFKCRCAESEKPRLAETARATILRFGKISWFFCNVRERTRHYVAHSARHQPNHLPRPRCPPTQCAVLRLARAKEIASAVLTRRRPYPACRKTSWSLTFLDLSLTPSFSRGYAR